MDSFHSVPDSKLFGRTFSRTKDRSGPQSGPSKKSTGTDTTPAKSPITQGSANKTRNMINKSPAAEAEFSSINRMFAEIDASQLDMETTKQAKSKEGAKSTGAEESPGSSKAKTPRGKAKESKGVTKSKESKRKPKRSA